MAEPLGCISSKAGIKIFSSPSSSSSGTAFCRHLFRMVCEKIVAKESPAGSSHVNVAKCLRKRSSAPLDSPSSVGVNVATMFQFSGIVCGVKLACSAYAFQVFVHIRMASMDKPLPCTTNRDPGVGESYVNTEKHIEVCKKILVYIPKILAIGKQWGI